MIEQILNGQNSNYVVNATGYSVVIRSPDDTSFRISSKPVSIIPRTYQQHWDDNLSPSRLGLTIITTLSWIDVSAYLNGRPTPFRNLDIFTDNLRRNLVPMELADEVTHPFLGPMSISTLADPLTQRLNDEGYKGEIRSARQMTHGLRLLYDDLLHIKELSPDKLQKLYSFFEALAKNMDTVPGAGSYRLQAA